MTDFIIPVPLKEVLKEYSKEELLDEYMMQLWKWSYRRYECTEATYAIMQDCIIEWQRRYKTEMPSMCEKYKLINHLRWVNQQNHDLTLEDLV